MNGSDFSERLDMILTLRREVNLAVMDAEDYRGMTIWGHAVWHAFQPFLRKGDVVAWVADIENILLPYMMDMSNEDEGWFKLVQELLPALRGLRLMDPNPYFGCERC